MFGQPIQRLLRVVDKLTMKDQVGQGVACQHKFGEHKHVGLRFLLGPSHSLGDSLGVALQVSDPVGQLRDSDA
jgi:hypothetical protein